MYDLCIVGSGPASYAIAASFLGTGKSVIVVEAGGTDYSEESQEYYKGSVIGDPYFDLEYARLRQVGGTSGHWGGMCRPMEPIVFEDYLPECISWPVGVREELSGFLELAKDTLDLPEQGFYARSVNSELNKINFTFSGSGGELPTRFSEKWRKLLSRSPKLTLINNAMVVGLVSSNGRVDSVRVKQSDDTVLLSARNFVLACGGLENSRLLMYFDELYGENFCRRNLPIGKYFMEHPHFDIGEAYFRKEVSATQYYCMSNDFLKANKVGNVGLRVEPFGGRSSTKRWLKDLMCLAPRLTEPLINGLGKHLNCKTLVRAAWEQLPNSMNRIELDSQRFDDCGIPLLNLHWRKFQPDYNSVKLAAIEFGRFLREQDLGVLKINEWVLKEKNYPDNDELAGYHHMGGTVMGNNSDRSVVDSDCKLHGSVNMYIVGSSVFPRSCHVNPTLTIVQMSHRLGEHLAAKA